MRKIKISIGFFVGALFLLTAAPTRASRVVVVASTIQDAVDRAAPGDIVFVPPGTYRENVVVNKNNLTITGSRRAVLDGDGLAGNVGIRVAPPPDARIRGFRLFGLTVKNYARHGVFLTRVDGYTISGGVYEDNAEYGVYPVRSTNGLIELNRASGSADAGIYVGQSDSAVIRRNDCFDNTTGIEIENSTHIVAERNFVIGNSVGISVFALPGRSVPVMEDTLIRANVVINNNRPNPIADPDEILSRLPSGSGILLIAADRTGILGNRVVGNHTTGIAVVQLPPDIAGIDPRVNPFPDGNLIAGNVVVHNGTAPDPRALLPSADLNWDSSGAGNRWINNIYQTSFPSVLP